MGLCMVCPGGGSDVKVLYFLVCFLVLLVVGCCWFDKMGNGAVVVEVKLTSDEA